MSDDLFLNGKTYVSSKKAAEETGYARDYIGQLSRGGLIDSERVGGLWYVSLDSLQNYERNAEIAKSFSPVQSGAKAAESSLSFEGKEYISASRASKLTGYNQDYVGQLARGNKIPSRQIGNRWYVDRDALVSHKSEKDALLAAVQAESVGIKAVAAQVQKTPEVSAVTVSHTPTLTYTQESQDLLPTIPEKSEQAKYPLRNFNEIRPRQAVPEFLQETKQAEVEEVVERKAYVAPRAVKRPRRRVLAVSAGVLTIILVLSVSFVGLKGTSTFAQLKDSEFAGSMSAGAASAVGGIGDAIEDIVSPELSYVRGQ